MVAAPRVSDQRVASSTAPLLASFNGVSSRDSAVTNFGAQFEPPDQGLCTGNGYVVEMVNSAYTIYQPNGTVVTGPYNVNGPFDEGLSEFTSDPRCHYDVTTHTWYDDPLHQRRQHAVACGPGRQHIGRSHQSVDDVTDRYDGYRWEHRSQARGLPVPG